MIQPATENIRLKSKQDSHILPRYYACAFFVCCVNFIPSFVRSKHGHSDDPIYYTAILWFCASFVLSLPLLVEFLLDMLAKATHPTVYNHHILDHSMGHGLLIASLFSSAIIVFGFNGTLFSHCFVLACQMLALTAIFGKLQVLGERNWRPLNVFPILLVFTGSQVLLTGSIVECLHDGETQCEVRHDLYIASVVLAVVAFLLHLNVSRSYRQELYKALFTKEGSDFFTTNRFSCLMLVSIVTVYMVVRMGVLYQHLGDFKIDLHELLQSHIVTQNVLASMAAILPGRMIRRMLILMKVRHAMP